MATQKDDQFLAVGGAEISTTHPIANVNNTIGLLFDPLTLEILPDGSLSAIGGGGGGYVDITDAAGLVSITGTGGLSVTNGNMTVNGSVTIDAGMGNLFFQSATALYSSITAGAEGPFGYTTLQIIRPSNYFNITDSSGANGFRVVDQTGSSLSPSAVTANNTLDDGSGSMVVNGTGAHFQKLVTLNSVASGTSYIVFSNSATPEIYLIDDGAAGVSFATNTIGGALHVSQSGEITTANNTLDDGSGNSAVAGGLNVRSGALTVASSGAASVQTTNNTLDDGHGGASFATYVTAQRFKPTFPGGGASSAAYLTMGSGAPVTIGAGVGSFYFRVDGGGVALSNLYVCTVSPEGSTPDTYVGIA